MGMKESNKIEVENSKNKQPSPKELLIKLERSITKKEYSAFHHFYGR